MMETDWMLSLIPRMVSHNLSNPVTESLLIVIIDNEEVIIK